MAESTAGVPAVRVYVYNRRLHFSGYMHNVPAMVVHDAEYAAGYFYDDAHRPSIYVELRNGGPVYLAELLEEMDVIDPPGRSA